MNQKNRTIRLWVSVIGIALVLMGLMATGAVKMNQVDENKGDIKNLEKEQKAHRILLERIDTNVENIKEDITELKNR